MDELGTMLGQRHWQTNMLTHGPTCIVNTSMMAAAVTNIDININIAVDDSNDDNGDDEKGRV